MDRMTSMATFVKVVESGGFSAATRTLGMSPSMATAHVQSLEERLGVRLLKPEHAAREPDRGRSRLLRALPADPGRRGRCRPNRPGAAVDAAGHAASEH